MSKIPTGWHLCDGTDGTPDLRGRVLQSFDLLNPIGAFLEAALPNIKGSFIADSWASSYINTDKITGAFEVDSYVRYSYQSSSETPGVWKYTFNASRSQPIYSDDCSTVQPPAYTVYYIIKIA